MDESQDKHKSDDKLLNTSDPSNLIRHILHEESVEIEEKLFRLNSLMELLRVINSNLEDEVLLQSILYTFQGQFITSNASILILDDMHTREPSYKLRANVGLDLDYTPFNISEGNPLINLLRGAIPFVKVKDQVKGKPFSHFHKLNKHLQAELIFPLRSKQKLNGLLLFGRKLDNKDFSQSELTYITLFSNLISIAVENLILQELVTLDRMTQLFNHQYFDDRLSEEFHRAKRYNHNLTLLLGDIDFFKKFNDSYGHQSGDFILKELAQLLKKSVRSTDIVARYGGEEFAIIIPENSLENGAIVAEKIRAAIEKKKFIGRTKKHHKITISFGVASIKCTGVKTKDELVRCADEALYKSKHRGRNCVTLYTP